MQAGKTTTFFYLTTERIFSVEWKVSLSPALADSPAMFQSEPWIQAADQIKGASYNEWRDFDVFVIQTKRLCQLRARYIYIYLFLFLKDGFSHHSGIIITIEEFQGILYRPRI